MHFRFGPRYPITYADWSSREYAAILRCILSGQVHEGPETTRLLLRLREMYSPSDVHLLNYAHHGIEIALSIFKEHRPERNEVIVPAYICPSVPQAVLNSGLQVQSVDVQDDLNLSLDSVRNAIGPQTLAVIAPHMYGCPAPIKEIEALCLKAGVFLIDDAAQVVGIRVGGRLLGTFGDMGVISFAQSKTIVTGIQGSGGVLLVNRPIWKEDVAHSCATLPPANGRIISLVDFLWNYVWNSYTGHTGYYFKRLLKVIGWRSPKSTYATRISNLEASIATAQLDRLEQMIEDKIRIMKIFHETLKDAEIDLPQYQPGLFLTRLMLRLPKFVDNSTFRRKALKYGIETRLGYAVPKTNKELQDRVEHLVGMPYKAKMKPTEIIDACKKICCLMQSITV